MMGLLRLTVPDFLPARLYWSSCRAVLVLAISLGLQTIVVLMVGIGPLAESTSDPATLTGAGLFFVSAEYDIQAYAAGCVATILFVCAGLWAWNRVLFRVGPDGRESAALRGTRFLLALAVVSFAVFWTVLGSIGPGLGDAGRVATGDLMSLAAPGVLAVVVTASAYGISRL
jgi:hypothetical protein